MINSAVTPEVYSEYRTFAVSHKIIYFSSENYCFCEKAAVKHVTLETVCGQINY